MEFQEALINCIYRKTCKWFSSFNIYYQPKGLTNLWFRFPRMEELGWGLCRRRLPAKCWTETMMTVEEEKNINKLQMHLQKKMLSFLSSFGKVWRRHDGMHLTHLQQCRTFQGLWVPSLDMISTSRAWEWGHSFLSLQEKTVIPQIPGECPISLWERV